QKRWLPSVGFGVYVYSANFFAGVSVPKFFANRLNGSAAVFATATNIARQYQNLMATAGYVFNVCKKVKFIPSFLMQYVPAYAPVSFDFNANFVFIDRVWLGAAYRLNDSYNFMLAVNATKQLRIGYAYDLTVSPLHQITTGTHEVMISFDADMTHGKITNPREMRYF
ncbi:MAG TPA: PorP/SprF family type IX secretion system membrane protein, partial [Chitinophagales bacterium]|nr:PorP/SprF family type IX secretion system membrane protein [Chitinophagales bacterium]